MGKMEEEAKIRCPVFLEEEKKIRVITDGINEAKIFREKVERSKELVNEAELLLSCKDYDDKNTDCKNCRRISQMRQSTGKLISEPRETIGGMMKGLSKSESGFGSILKNLGGFIDLVKMMEDGTTEIERSGEIKGLKTSKGVRGVYGFTVRTMPGGPKRAVKIERFGNIKKDDNESIKIDEIREPIIDVFDEKDHVNVIAEIPGVSENDIKTELKGDILIVSAESNDRKYNKEILLPKEVKPETMKSSYRNGILELKFGKDTRKKRG